MYVYKVVCDLKVNIKYFQMFPKNIPLCSGWGRNRLSLGITGRMKPDSKLGL